MCVSTELLPKRGTETMMSSSMQGPSDMSWVMSHGWHGHVFRSRLMTARLGFPCFRWEEILTAFHREHKSIKPSKPEKAATVETQAFMPLCMCVITSVKEIPTITCSASVFVAWLGCIPKGNAALLSFVSPSFVPICSLISSSSEPKSLPGP